MSQHDWFDEPRSDLGEPRARCRYCGVMRHWPLADDPCSTARRTVIQRSSKRKAYARKRMAAPTMAHWPGPYRDGEASRKCRRCAVVFRRPIAMTRCEFCGPLCAWEASRSSQVERAARVREKKLAANSGRSR